MQSGTAVRKIEGFTSAAKADLKAERDRSGEPLRHPKAQEQGFWSRQLADAPIAKTGRRLEKKSRIEGFTSAAKADLKAGLYRSGEPLRHPKAQEQGF